MKPGVIMSTPDLRLSLMSILSGLQQVGVLDHVVTTIGISASLLKRRKQWPVFGPPLNKLMSKRVYPDFLHDRMSFYSSREMCRIVSARTGMKRLTHRVWHWAELGFDRHVARQFAGRSAWLYGMEHSSMASFQRQRAMGGNNVMRMVNADGRYLARILKEEAHRFPHWVNNYYRQLLNDQQDTLDRKQQEYELTDLFIANASFVKETLVENGLAADKIYSIPTGCPATSVMIKDPDTRGRPLRFVFVGSLSLRKGVPYLLEAWKSAAAGTDAVLTLAGSNEMGLTSSELARYDVDYRGVLDSTSLVNLLDESDVFVLPTLAEGLAHSALEALSRGLPIISTRESGLGSFLKQGHNGWLIPARDVSALTRAFEEAMNQPEKLSTMGKASHQIASEWTVDHSNQAHQKCITQILNRTIQHG